ncbi:MAG TPA: phage tail sheath subtilisin-like domain-containing protein [Allosphingosinicella sp.]|nr:phage tail sheath subtilisin-like domain-containing protein [Allosphingosinicella sp.]
MPEYLAPGVFVEEVSFRAKSIEGVSTTTTGFVGPCRYGPLDIEPEIITSLVEFERVYGEKSQLVFEGSPVDNYMWNAVRAFFEEGGKRLYVSRIFNPADDTGVAAGPPGSPPDTLDIRARFPGEAGNGRVTITLSLTPNRLASTPDGLALRGAIDRDVVFIGGLGAADGPYLAMRDEINRTWRFSKTGDPADPSLELQTDLGGATVRTVTASVMFESSSGDLPTFVRTELAIDPLHATAGSPDSLFAYFAPDPASLSQARSIPIVIERPGSDVTGLDVLDAITDAYELDTLASPPDPGLEKNLTDSSPTPLPAARRSIVVMLADGNDGAIPQPSDYEGEVDPATDRATGLKAFEALEDISIVAAPGSTRTNDSKSHAVIGLVIGHAERMRYRIAVIDSAKGDTIAQTRQLRALYDSSHAAFYYPWVKIIDPVTQQENHYPPSGFVAGIYARNDIERAVYKAPANEVVNLAIGFETMLNKAQQEVLNPEGVNCFRFFEGRGMRLWGARTMASDPEWKYVNIRRYFAYLERSIDKGTQWAVFEPNGERLWANVRSTVADFLLNEWQNGALLGDKPEKAYFVKCDRSTMSQNDLDNGRLICLVGVAALKPAEFVIFRIGQWTADRKI